MKYIVTLSPLLKSALLLCAGLSIFGFADNFIMLISDQVGVGQFHFSRSLIASLAVICFAFYFNENLTKKHKNGFNKNFFNVIAMILYFGVIP